MRFRSLILAAPLLLGPIAGAYADDNITPELNIRLNHGSVWQATVKENKTEGFLEIHNDGATDDVLTGWTCPNADKTVLMGKDGKPLTQLTIPAKQTVTLAPGEAYLALTGLHYPVVRGSILPCSFTFQQAGDLGGFLNEIKRPKK